MSSLCYASLHVCRARFTKLDASGFPLVGASSSYVTDSLTTVGITPEIVTGQDLEVIDGCGCPRLTYRGKDRIKRYTFAIEQPTIEPELIAMLTDAATILGDDDATTIGTIYPDDTGSCAGLPNGVAAEFWADAWDNGQPLSAAPYRRFLFTRTIWTEGDSSLSADFAPQKLTGYTIVNRAFGDPYDDLPTNLNPGDIAQGAQWVEATAPPEAACAVAALASS